MSGSILFDSNEVVATGQASILTLETIPTGISLYINGVLDQQALMDITPQWVTPSLGVKAPELMGQYVGEIGEVLVLDQQIAPSQRRAIESYLGKKWGIQVDGDGDGVSDLYDMYPSDPDQVVTMPPALNGLKANLMWWVSGSGDMNGNGSVMDEGDVPVAPFVMDASKRVSKWFDWSGKQRHATQPTLNMRPLAATSMNRLTALSLDGVGMFMGVAKPVGFHPGTLLAVIQPNNALSTMRVMAGNTGAYMGLKANAVADNGAVVVGGYGTTDLANSTSYLGASSPILVVMTVGNDQVVTLNVNGSQEGVGTAPATVGSEGFVVGRNGAQASDYFNGRLGELMAFDKVLSSQEIASVSRYLAIKWGISSDADQDGVPDIYDAFPDVPTAAIDVMTVSPTLNQVGALSALTRWYMADRGINDKNGAVVAMYDMSGNKAHAVQNQGALLPVLHLNGLNGKPVVRFDGVNDVLRLKSGSGVNAPLTMLMVTRRLSATPEQWVVGDSSGFGFGYADVASVGVTLNQQVAVSARSDSAMAMAPELLGLEVNGQGTVYVNGVQMLSVPTMPGSYDGIGIGGNNTRYFQGDVAELMVFTSTLGAQDRYRVESYLASKWGLSIDTDGDGTPNEADVDPIDYTRSVTLAAKAPELAGLSEVAKAGMVWWLAGDGDGVRVSGDRLVSWADWGQSRAVALGQVANKRPVVGAGLMGGRWSVGFNGDQAVTLRQRPVMGNAMTLYMVGQPTANHDIDTQSLVGSAGLTGQRYVLHPDAMSGVAGSIIGISWGRNGVSLYERDATRFAPVLVDTTPMNRPAVIMVSYQNQRPSLYVNGALKATQTVESAMPLVMPTSLGGGSEGSYAGMLSEVLAFNTALDSQDRYVVDTYWGKKWGVAMDTDGDGVPNNRDAYPTDNTRTIDLAPLMQSLGKVSSAALSSLQIWLMGGASGAIVGDDNQLSSWIDMSGKGRHAQLIAGMTGPTMVTVNARPYMRFATGQALGMAGSALVGNPYEMIVIESKRTTDNALLLSGTDPTATLRMGYTSDTTWEVSQNANRVTLSHPFLSQQAPRVVRIMNNGSRQLVQVDGVWVVTGNATLFSALPNWQLGGQYNGDVGEVMVWQGELSGDDRYWVDTYLANKWGVVVDTDMDGVPNQMDAYPTDNRRTLEMAQEAPELTSWGEGLQQDIMLWLRAGRTIQTVSGNQGVFQWVDMSGKGWHAIQPTASLRPSVVSVTPSLNQVMALSNGQSVVIPAFPIPQTAYTLVVVAKRTVASDNTMLITAPDGSFGLGYATDNTLSVRHGGTLTGGNEWVNADPMVITLEYDPAMGKRLRWNGAIVTMDTQAMVAPAVKGLQIGAPTLNGWVGEVMMIGQLLATPDRAVLDQYLSSRWGIMMDTDSDGAPNQLDALPLDRSRVVLPAQFEEWATFSSTPNVTLWAIATPSAWVVKNGTVARWLDWSGYGNHLLQPSVNQQPSTVVADGRLSVRFDGVMDAMRLPRRAWGQNGYSMAIVETKRGINTGSRGTGPMVGMQQASGNGFQWAYAPNTTGVSVRVGGVLTSVSKSMPEDTLRYHFVQVSPTAGVTLYQDGVVVTMNRQANAILPLGIDLALGSDGVTPPLFYEGDIHEVMMFDRVLSTEDRYVVDQQMAKRWKVLVDTDGDGYYNQEDDAPMDPSIGRLDADGDGVDNFYDYFPYSPEKVMDLAQWSPSLNRLSAVAQNGLMFWGISNRGYVVTGNSNSVVSWRDVSGYQRHLSQSNVSLRPSVIGGALPVLRFDAVDLMGFPASLVSGNYSVYIVQSRRAPLSRGNWLTVTSNTGVTLNIGFSDANTIRVTQGTSSLSVSGNDIGSTSQWVLGVHFNRQTGLSVAVNGAIRISSASMTTPFDGASGAQWGDGINGDVGEVLLFNTTLLPGDRYLVDEYLQRRWGITMDSDGDGSPNSEDPDSFSPLITATDWDGDGVLNVWDRYPTDNTKVVDMGGFASGLDRVSADVLARLSAWWIAMPSFVAADVTGVSKWLDISGRRQHAVQSIGTQRPQITSSGGVTSIRFDGADDWLAAPFAMANSPYTIYMIEKRQPSTTLNPLLGSDVGVTLNYIGGNGLQAIQGNSNVLLTVPSSNQTRFRMIGMRVAGNQLMVSEATQWGGGAQVNASVAPLTTDGTLMLGRGLDNGVPRSYNGEMAEMMVFKGEMPESLTYQVETYLSDRWGIPLDSDYDGIPNSLDAYPTDNAKVFSYELLSYGLLVMSPSLKNSLMAFYDGKSSVLWRDNGNGTVNWLDRSDRKQALSWAGTSQPVYEVVSGNAGLRFNGSHQVLQRDGITGPSSGTPLQVWVAFTPKQLSSGTLLSFGDQTATTGNSWGIRVVNGSIEWTVRTVTSNGVVTASAMVVPSATMVVMAQVVGDSMSLFVNGKPMGTQVVGVADANTGRLMVGGQVAGGSVSSFYDGLLGDVMLFSSTISLTDRMIMDNYMQSRWGVAMDTDGDGEVNATDPYPMDARRNTLDLDGDGVPNRLDPNPNDPQLVVTLGAISPSLNALSAGARTAMKGWWVASTNSTVLTDSGQVSQWFDWSGKQHHLKGAGSLPVLTADGKGIQFSGAQWLEGGADADFWMTENRPFTIVAVYKPNSSIGIQTIFANAINGARGGYGMYTQTGRLRGIRSDGVNGDIQALTILPSSVMTVLVATYTGTEWQLRYNGFIERSLATTAGWEPQLTAPLQVGAIRATDGQMGNFLQGTLSELMVFAGDISMTDRYVIDEYLSSKWGMKMDTDSDVVFNDVDRYPTNANKVIDWPSGLMGLDSQLKLWSSLDTNSVKVDAFNKVAAWADLSGNLNHLVQSNASLRPIVSTADNRANMMLTGGSFLTSALSVTGNASVFALVKTPASLATAVDRVLMGSSQTGGLTWVYSGVSKGLKMMQANGVAFGTSKEKVVLSNELFASQYYVLELNWSDDTDTLVYRVNGIEIGRGVAQESFTGSGVLQLGAGLGSFAGWDGSVLEVMVFNRALAEAESKKVTTYLSGKWGLDVDSDGDTVSDAADMYPLDPSKVIDLPAWMVPMSPSLKTWLSMSGDNNGDGDTLDAGDVPLAAWSGQMRKINRWADWSGNRNHGVQVVADRQPSQSDDGGISFDGVNDGLDTTAPSGGLAYTALVVAKTGTMGSARTLLGSQSNGGLSWVWQADGQMGVGRSGISPHMGDATMVTSVNAAQRTGLYVLTWSDAANALEIRYNGTVMGSTSKASASFDGGKLLRIGSDVTGLPWNGQIYEVMVFDRVLSMVELRQLEYSVSVKWGLEIDSDGDGVIDRDDRFPFDETKVVDTASANATLKFGDLLSNVVLWLNPSEVKQYGNLSDGRMRIYDLTGKRNHATAPLAAQSPQMVTGVGGRSSLKFDGISKVLEIPYASIHNPSEYTVVMVGRLVGTTGQKQVLFESMGDGKGVSLGTNENASLLTLTRGNGSGSVASAVGVNPMRAGTAMVLMIDQDSKMTRVWRNGGLETAMMGGFTPNQSKALRIGATKNAMGQDSGFANFELSEFMVLNRRLTEVERQRVNRYMMARYGIFIFDPVSFQSLFF